MSKYEPIVPTTNPFNLHGASIEIETDKEAGGGMESITLKAIVIQNQLPHIL